MRIYTKTGDTGESSLFRGGRVPKDHMRLEAYGTLDELNAALGLAIANLPEMPAVAAEVVLRQLRQVQRDLFCLGAELATSGPERPAWHLVPEDVARLEGWIDEMDAVLPELTNFILPGGHPVGAALHLARTTARRAERQMVGLWRHEDPQSEVAQAQASLGKSYINRLSDHLFVLGRWANHQAGRPEAPLEV